MRSWINCGINLNYKTFNNIYISSALQKLRKKYPTKKESDTTFLELYNSGLYLPKLVGYLNKGEKGIFQRRYFEHTIIDEKDLNNQINYIHYNPVKHGYAKSVKDWKYSSFHKFVKNKFYDINWGSNTDIKEIIDLDFE